MPAPEAQRYWHQEVPWVLWLLWALEVPGHRVRRLSQVVPEVREAPECQANLGFQAPPGVPQHWCLEVQALPECPSVLEALELLVDQAGLVYRADPHLQDLALLWDLVSQAVPIHLSTPPAG